MLRVPLHESVCAVSGRMRAQRLCGHARTVLREIWRDGLSTNALRTRAQHSSFTGDLSVLSSAAQIPFDSDRDRGKQCAPLVRRVEALR
jgi:hypothetical protein